MNMRSHLSAFGLVLLATPAFAAPPSATAEYSADWSMENEGGAITAKVYHGANKERREMKMGGGESMTSITRTDRQVAWTLMPGQRMYMETSLAAKDATKKDAADMSGYDIEQTVVGEETVNGVKTTKAKIIMKAKPPNTRKMGGFMWTSQEGILVKLDVIGIEGDSKYRMKTELTNLKLGKQAAALFDIPPGYRKMDMGGMGGMGAMMGGFGKMPR